MVGSLMIGGLFAKLMYQLLYKGAQIRAARQRESRARQARARHHAAHRAACEAALITRAARMPYSILMSRSFTSFDHFARSLLMKSANSLGEPPPSSLLCEAIRPLTSG